MNSLKRRRAPWLLWIAAAAFLIALLLLPVSYRVTRFATLVGVFTVWFGLIILVWSRRAIRLALIGVTFLVAGFLALPARALPSSEVLRADYTAALQRYEGVAYWWGGESSRGIDCSGLIRCGLIDALFHRGIRTFDAGLVRQSLGLWWNDCTAKALGEQHLGLTRSLFNAPAINALDHAMLLPGDLAVTANGVHILAYLGNQRWIEADPGDERVITVTVPAVGNAWFQAPVNIVRWSILQ